MRVPQPRTVFSVNVMSRPSTASSAAWIVPASSVPGKPRLTIAPLAASCNSIDGIRPANSAPIRAHSPATPS